MTAPRQAYSSTVIARRHLLAGAAAGAAIAAGLHVLAPVSLAGPLAGLSVLVTAAYLASVRVTVGAGRVILGQGPLPWPTRVIPVSLIADARAENLTSGQVFGIGVPWHRRTTRMTVRPGPTLVLSLRTGEWVRVSTRDPGAAVAIIRSAHPQPVPTRENS
jgi:hypothetical protein